MGNYRYCGDSQIGKSHENSGTKCQDSFDVFVHADFCVAAVADGLGSSKHSDIASSMAVKSTVKHCAGNIKKGMPERDVLHVIKKAFDNANFEIKQRAGNDLDDYDTTLSLAVFISGDVYYGHAGDSGIIALRSDGIFEEVTVPQLGAGIGKERPVYPLAAESRWVFGKYEHRAKALFLMTDGVLNKAVPPLLEDQQFKLDHAYLYYLYDNICKNPNLGNWIRKEVSDILPQEVNYDDKTLLIVSCDSVKLKFQQNVYYTFPSSDFWSELLNKRRPQRPPPPPPPPPEPTRKLRMVAILSASVLLIGVAAFIFIFIYPGLNEAPPSGEVIIGIKEPRIGDLIYGSLKTDNYNGKLSYVWKVNDKEVGVGKLYKVQSSDLGERITLEITIIEKGITFSSKTAAVIKKEPPKAPPPPEVHKVLHNSVTLKENELFEFSMNGIKWQDSNVFEDLEIGNEYLFYQRIAETADTEASGKSEALEVRIDMTTEGIQPTSPTAGHTGRGLDP